MAVPIANQPLTLGLSESCYDLPARVIKHTNDVLKLSRTNIPEHVVQGQHAASDSIVTDAAATVLQCEVDSQRLQILPLEKRLEMLKLLQHGVDETAPLASQESILNACQERVVPTQELVMLRKKVLLEKLAAYEHGRTTLRKLQALAQQQCESLNLKKELLQKEQVLADALRGSPPGCELNELPITRSRIVAQEAELVSKLSQQDTIRHQVEHEQAVVCSLKEVCSDYEEIIAKQNLQLETATETRNAPLIDSAVTSFDRTSSAEALCYLRSAVCQGSKLQCTFGAKHSPCVLTVDFARACNSEAAIINNIEVTPAYLLSKAQLTSNFVGTSNVLLLVTTVLRQWSLVAPLAAEISDLRERFALDWQPEQDPHIIRVILGKKGNMATLKVPCDYRRGGLVIIQSVSGCEESAIEVPNEKRSRVSTTVEFLTSELARRV